MASQKIAKMFIDDTTAQVLDNMHRILKDYLGNKKEAEKILKYLVKTIIKIGILYRNDQFNLEELRQVEVFKQKFHSLAMTLISFHEVDFTFDKNFLVKSLDDCKHLIMELVGRHLTDKSKTRIDFVFSSFSKPDLLTALFQQNSQYKDALDNIVTGMHKMMDEGNL